MAQIKERHMDLFKLSINNNYNIIISNAPNLNNINIDDDYKNIILWDTDSCESVTKFQKTKVYRTSILKSKRGNNEFSLPACLDYSFTKHFKYTNDKPLDNFYTIIPSVGFCGNLCLQYTKARQLVNSAFLSSNQLKCDIIQRKCFVKDESLFTLENRQNEFYNNMKNNTFILATRGGGNWSMRFYEIMCAGRIPVLLDTDILLPKEDEINWEELIIIDKNVDKLVKKVIEWNSYGKEFIYNKQNEIFNVWFNKLRPQIFFNNL
jgi:hypothetical protein